MKDYKSGKSMKLFTAGLALLLTLSMIVLLFAGTALAATDSVTRLSGANRWATSANVALEAYPDGSENVIIARGDDAGGWADGLAGGYLAGVLDAPILLTAPNTLPAAVEDAIGDLGAQKAYILGGTGAVSANVKTQLEDLGLEVERISGANREATAAQIAGMGEVANNTAFVVQGRAPADSMVAGAAAFAKNYPILLVNKDSVPEVTASAITNLGIENIIIVGGSGVVSTGVATELGNIPGVTSVTRLSGVDRVATSVAFAEGQFPNYEDFSIVNGWHGLADAVGASVFGNPILYVNSLPEVVNQYLEEVVTTSSIFNIFGGTAVVSANVGNLLIDIVDEAPPGPNLVVLLPQTGILQEFAETSAEAALLAAADVNAWLVDEKEEWRLYLTIQDTHLNHKLGLRLVEKWNKKGVKFFVGPMASGVAEGVLDYANTNELLLISPSSTAPHLALDDWLFRFCYIEGTEPPDEPILGTKSWRNHVKQHILNTLGREPDEYAYNTYDAIWVLAVSIVEKGYNSSEVRDNLPQIAYDWSEDYAASGLIVLNDNGDRIAPTP